MIKTEDSQSTARLDELERTCFVIMPFGEKKVGDKLVDFTALYNELFEPAIRAATTPEGRALIPARTDMDAFSSSINQEMFEYIMYSRLAFADISSLNPNVFYEIGARHSAQEAGTVLFRQTGHPIPFDIQTIKVFEYESTPDTGREASRKLITDVLTETLKRNRLDSPVRLALRAQRSGMAHVDSGRVQPDESAVRMPAHASDGKAIERFLRDAEEALRVGDLDLARTNYWVVLRLDPLNTIARMRLGLVLKRQGKHHEALEEFVTVTKLAPDYGEAWKEKGVVEGLIAREIKPSKRPAWLQDGVASLERATQLIPDDFDAWASLGGVFKNVRKDNARALEMYRHAARISNGHPYPLLNALKLEAKQHGKLDLAPVKQQLAAAETLRQAQLLATPAADVPWSYFDLAEIRLYEQDEAGFLEDVRQGISHCRATWQPKTFRNSLKHMLVDSGIDLPGLSEGIHLLDNAITHLSR